MFQKFLRLLMVRSLTDHEKMIIVTDFNHSNKKQNNGNKRNSVNSNLIYHANTDSYTSSNSTIQQGINYNNHFHFHLNFH